MRQASAESERVSWGLRHAPQTLAARTVTVWLRHGSWPARESEQVSVQGGRRRRWPVGREMLGWGCIQRSAATDQKPIACQAGRGTTHPGRWRRWRCSGRG